MDWRSFGSTDTTICVAACMVVFEVGDTYPYVTWAASARSVTFVQACLASYMACDAEDAKLALGQMRSHCAFSYTCESTCFLERNVT